ncbi:MAG: hypothetical protein OEQ18_02600, partial [Gammaproteobacteria bacterium]|nr:hypothetical protein [Gammaproteobacteria bacterium]
MASASPAECPGKRTLRFVEFAALLLLFAGSVWLRAPHLGRPLAHNFEWLSAHTLIVHEIWHEQGGPSAHLFAQSMSYDKPADLYINNAAMSYFYQGYPADGHGRYYDPSHPSLGVVVPYYLAFALWDTKPNALGLQVFNMGVQFSVRRVRIFDSAARDTGYAQVQPACTGPCG